MDLLDYARHYLADAYRRGKNDGQQGSCQDSYDRGRAEGIELVRQFIYNEYMDSQDDSADEFLYDKLQNAIQENFQ